MSNYPQMKKFLNDMSNLLIVLGDQKRQAIIIKLLENINCDGLQVTQLMEAAQLSRPAVSHHPKILKDAKIINYRSKGTKNFYYLTHEINKLQTFLDEAVTIMKQGNMQ